MHKSTKEDHNPIHPTDNSSSNDDESGAYESSVYGPGEWEENQEEKWDDAEEDEASTEILWI